VEAKMATIHIGYDDTINLLSWQKAVDALREGHFFPKAEIADIFLGPKTAILLNRAAYIEGLGYGVKAVTVIADNPKRGLPTVQGAMMVYEPKSGELKAIIDSRLITEVKTASDSILGAQLLARPKSKRLLILGAGTVAESLVRAYSSTFPEIEQIAIWARRPEQAKSLVDKIGHTQFELITANDLEVFASKADIISTATMAHEPILMGDWVSPGTHIDLIGAFTADMREVDDDLITSGTIYVDSRDTTINHIGELMIPIAAGVIDEKDIKGDFYDLISLGQTARGSESEITIFKNGGGAHLDLMIANYLIQLIE
jgi:ornithine cyclodeaminase